jgi:hypothetical protein
MAYWNSEINGNDFAFDSIGAIVFLIKERMDKDLEVVKTKKYPEQSLLANLRILRNIGNDFPKELSVIFRKKDLSHYENEFNLWFSSVESKLPKQYINELRENAIFEFTAFKKQLNTKG